jgi:hypothetical protein
MVSFWAALAAGGAPKAAQGWPEAARSVLEWSEHNALTEEARETEIRAGSA